MSADSIDLAIYSLKKDNIAIPSTDGITKQQGDQTSKGFETEIRVEPLLGWYLFVSYAYTDAELTKFYESVPIGQDDYGRPINAVVDRTGNKAAFVPEHILNIWTTYEFSNGFGIGGGLRYLDEQFIHVDNVFNLDKALIFDAIAYYKWNWLKLSISVKNFTEESYELRGFGATAVIPAVPRAMIGKINLYF